MQEHAKPHDGEQLISLLSRQRELYQRLKDLSDRQRTLISGDQPEALLGILNERQELVRGLTSLNSTLAPYRRQWETSFEKFTEPVRTRVSKLLTAIDGLLSGIMKTDQEDGALLSARKQAVANELSGLSGGRAANVGYASAARPAEESSADLTG